MGALSVVVLFLLVLGLRFGRPGDGEEADSAPVLRFLFLGVDFFMVMILLVVGGRFADSGGYGSVQTGLNVSAGIMFVLFFVFGVLMYIEVFKQGFLWLVEGESLEEQERIEEGV